MPPVGRRWAERIPLGRKLPFYGTPSPFLEPIRYGDYFTAAADFLKDLGADLLASAGAAITGRPEPAEALRQIRIFLEKHGAFYHPARVELDFGGRAVSLALNVALTKEGVRCMETEVPLLGMLLRRHQRWLPRLFYAGSGKTASGQPFPMFLAEWFDGFCEFHLAGGGDRTVIWDPATGPRRAGENERRELYRGIARIWADYYQLETGARIHPWHHAAGDFVARAGKKGVELRLITVRGYPSTIQGEGAGPDRILRELLVAFFDLSLRTRIDRNQGTGDLVWADDGVVEPTLIGAAEALVDKPAVPGRADPPAQMLIEILAALAEPQLAALAWEAAENGFFPGSPELDLIGRRLAVHAGQVGSAAKGLAG
ncbi:MAG: hypothetical protein K9K88_17755 [Desulfobacterales bacterium]|nr:hypothetical protein [Desulfobacterales bacterium]